VSEQGALAGALSKLGVLAQRAIAKTTVLWVKFHLWNFQTVV
jgi:hypothetical protein